MRSHSAGATSLGALRMRCEADGGDFSACRISAVVVVRFKASSDTKNAMVRFPRAGAAPNRAHSSGVPRVKNQVSQGFSAFAGVGSPCRGFDKLS